MRKQPIGPFRINRRHPLSRGLVGFWLPGSPYVRNHAGPNHHGTWTNNTIHSFKANENGTYLHMEPSAGVDERLPIGSSGPTGPGLSGKSEFTVATRANLIEPGPTVEDFPRFIEKSDGSAARNGWAFFANRWVDYSIRLTLQDGATGDRTNYDYGYTGFDEWRTHIISARDDLTVLSNFTATMDGVPQTVVKDDTGSGGPSSITAASVPMYIASWHNNTERRLTGGMEFVCVWDRYLNEAEQADFASDPYQVTEPVYDYLSPTGKAAAIPLVANNLISLSSIGSPTLGQIYGLTADDLAAATSVGVPTLGQTHGLTADDLAALSSVAQPVIGQAHGLTASDLIALSSVGSPELAAAVAARVVAMRAGASSVTMDDGATSATIGNDGTTEA